MVNIILKLHDYNLVLKAELAAIDEAISWCIGSPHVPFHLYTDRMYSIYATQRLFTSNGRFFKYILFFAPVALKSHTFWLDKIQ